MSGFAYQLVAFEWLLCRFAEALLKEDKSQVNGFLPA